MLRKLVVLFTMAPVAVSAFATASFGSASPSGVSGEAAGGGHTPVSASRCLLPARPHPGAVTSPHEAPLQLGYTIAVVGTLNFSGEAFGLLPECDPELCQSVLLLGFLVPDGAPSRADLVFRLSGVPQDLDVEVSVFAADVSSPELFPVEVSEDASTGEWVVVAPGLPIGSPQYLACGWLEIQLSLTAPFEPPNPITGSDTLVLREVTLGPGSG